MMFSMCYYLIEVNYEVLLIIVNVIKHGQDATPSIAYVRDKL